MSDENPIKLDIGCGKNKQPGHIGVDAIAFEGVDTVMNVVQRTRAPLYDDMDQIMEPAQYKPWPWKDDEVDYIHTSHFVEHLTREEWIPFFNEAHRVLKVGGQLHCITPHWTHACAYGDPTHRSFLSEWVVMYLNKGWRDVNAPHAGYTCDFDWGSGASFDEWLFTRNQEVREFATKRYVNSCRDLIFTLTKRAPT